MSRAARARLGRDPDHIKILPGCLVVVGDTVEEAQQKRALLDSLVHPDSGIASLSIALGLRRVAIRSRRAAARYPGKQRLARAAASGSSRAPGATI